MRRFYEKIVRFLSTEDGPTAVEYAVMLALLIIVCMVSIALIGSQTSKNFSNTALTMSGS